MFCNSYLIIFYKHLVKTLNFISFYTQTDRQTDRQTDHQTFVPIVGPTRTLKTTVTNDEEIQTYLGPDRHDQNIKFPP